MTTSNFIPLTQIARIKSTLIETLRFLAILLPGFLALFLVVRAFVNGHVSDITFALWLLPIQAASLLVPNPILETSTERRRFLLKLAGLLPPIAALFPLTVVLLIFGQLDSAAFVFHLVFGIDGTPLAGFTPYIVTVAIYWASILITLYRLRRWIRHVPFWWSLSVAVMVFGNPVLHEIVFNEVQAKYSRLESLMPEFQEPTLIPTTQGENPDLIILYLEGLEGTYGIDAAFGHIYDPIERLSEQGVAFTNVGQIRGTGWSLAGMIATQCGMPLMPLGSRPLGRTADIKSIAPNLTCLTDVLHARGYHSTYASTTEIIGSDRGHYGFDNFYGSHQLNQIIDLNNATTPGAIAARNSGVVDSWGLRDAEGFAIALAHVKERLQSDQPYALILSTMDTHGPKGYTSPQCQRQGLPAIDDDLTHAIKCTTALTEEFIADLQTLTADRDTRIIVTSDHLAHQNNLTPILNQFERRNRVILLNGPEAPQVIDTPAAMPDIYPTLLNWLGWLAPDVPQQAGIGTSLLQNQPTLTQRLGMDAIDDRLRLDVELSHHFWHQAPRRAQQ